MVNSIIWTNATFVIIRQTDFTFGIAEGLTFNLIVLGDYRY